MKNTTVAPTLDGNETDDAEAKTGRVNVQPSNVVAKRKVSSPIKDKQQIKSE